MQIYIARNGEKYGPYTLDQVQFYLNAGQIKADDLAWYEGLQSWITVPQVPGVRAAQGQTKMPPPPTVTPQKAIQQVFPPSPSGLDKFLHGPVNKAMMCPHCNTKGYVHIQHTKKKRGVSGGKATAAVLTGGLSLLAVGLSRKEKVTEAYCGNCKNTWLF